MKPLSSANQNKNEALKAAMAALFHLDAHGVVVKSIAIDQRNPVLAIEPHGCVFLRGSLKSRITVGGFHRCVMATVVHGCQVEWDEIYPVAREALNS